MTEIDNNDRGPRHIVSPQGLSHVTNSKNYVNQPTMTSSNVPACYVPTIYLPTRPPVSYRLPRPRKKQSSKLAKFSAKPNSSINFLSNLNVVSRVVTLWDVSEASQVYGGAQTGEVGRYAPTHSILCMQLPGTHARSYTGLRQPAPAQ